MLHLSRRRLASVCGALVIGGLRAPVAAAPQSEPQQDLSATLEALQAQIDQLKAQQKAIQQQQADQQKEATTDAVLKDADRHSQFMQLNNLNAGWSPDYGFFLRSDDGNFLLHPWFHLQIRDETNYRNNVKHGGNSDDFENGFEIHHLRFGFDGNAFTPDLTYLLLWDTDRRNGSVNLSEAWAKYHVPNSPWAIKGGQFKNPLDHEELIPDKLQLAADRTLTSDIFFNGQGFVQGVSAIYDPGNNSALRAEIAFTDGYNSFNQNFQDFPTTNADYGFAGRVEYKVRGDWRDYTHFTSQGNREDLVVLGAGADWTGIGHVEQFLHTFDGQWNGGPLALWGAYAGRYRARGGLTGGDTYDPSVRLQAAYLLSRHWEIFGRYAYLHFDSKEFPAGTQVNVHEVTLGVNYYLRGQAAKFTFDLTYLPNGSPVADDLAGILIDNDHAELLLRGQFQLLL